MELNFAYGQVEERLKRLDFSALYRGFSRFPFALYDDTQAYINGDFVAELDGALHLSRLWRQ